MWTQTHMFARMHNVPSEAHKNATFMIVNFMTVIWTPPSLKGATASRCPWLHFQQQSGRCAPLSPKHDLLLRRHVAAQHSHKCRGMQTYGASTHSRRNTQTIKVTAVVMMKHLEKGKWRLSHCTTWCRGDLLFIFSLICSSPLEKHCSI